MMQIWIVWSDKPLAAFSSEARARAYISRHKAETHWACSPAGINAEDFAGLHPAALLTAQHSPSHRTTYFKENK
jgi:hypothetical protein